MLLAVLAAFVPAKAQVNIPYQEIPYDVHYHWGLVDLMIAHGLVTIQTEGQNFSATLDGNSIPWEGRVFCVSDTLQATMTPTDGLSHETVTYENGWYMKPKASQYRSDGFDPSNPANYKNIQGQGELNASGSTMEAITVTADMLGLFYYFREMDFDNMTPGNSITIPISVPGGYDQSVVVTYNGCGDYNGSPTFDVDFQYTYHGVPSGYTVQARVDTARRIPLLISANLPAGHVEMIQTPV